MVYAVARNTQTCEIIPAVIQEMCIFTYEVEQWYVRHNCFIVLLHRQHVSTYIQVIFRPSFTDKSIRCYTCWDFTMLTEVKYIKTKRFMLVE